MPPLSAQAGQGSRRFPFCAGQAAVSRPNTERTDSLRTPKAPAPAPETRPGCPDWCRGHYAHDSAKATHVSAHAYTAPAALINVSAITVSLTLTPYDKGPQVMVMSHSLDDDPTSVCLEIAEAERWANILDAAGATELATAIRSTLALTAEEGDRHP
jgi:hypothetical protein